MTLKEARKLARDPELLATFQLLVNAKLAQWDLERDIEHLLERSFDGMDAALEQFCGGCGITHTCTRRDLAYYLRDLREEE